MEFQEVLDTRRSIRSFTGAPLTEEELTALLHAGAMAPSAMNVQPWDFIVVTDQAVKDEFARRHPYAHYAGEAGAILVVCGNPEGPCGDFWIQDCSAATQNILLAARDLGLGSVWCGVHPVQDRVDMVRELLGIPENRVPLNLICIGKTEKAFTRAHRGNPAKIHRERW